MAAIDVDPEVGPRGGRVVRLCLDDEDDGARPSSPTVPQILPFLNAKGVNMPRGIYDRSKSKRAQAQPEAPQSEPVGGGGGDIHRTAEAPQGARGRASCTRSTIERRKAVPGRRRPSWRVRHGERGERVAQAGA
jgi:hypothetical protein